MFSFFLNTRLSGVRDELPLDCYLGYESLAGGEPASPYLPCNCHLVFNTKLIHVLDMILCSLSTPCRYVCPYYFGGNIPSAFNFSGKIRKNEFLSNLF